MGEATKRRGGASEVLPLQKVGGGGGVEKVSTMLKCVGEGGGGGFEAALTQELQVLAILKGAQKVSCLEGDGAKKRFKPVIFPFFFLPPPPPP